MDTPLTSFKALVKFQFDMVGFNKEIADVRRQLQSLTGTVTKQVRIKYIQPKKQVVEKQGMDNAHVRAYQKQLASLQLPKTLLQNVRLKYLGIKKTLPTITQKVKLLTSSKTFLQNVKLNYTGRLKTLKPALTQQVKLVYTNRLTTLPPITQHVNMVYHNRQGGAGGAGGSGGSGSPNPWHIAGGGGMLAGNNVRAFGATIGVAGAANQMYDTGNFQVGLQPQYEFLTGSAEGAKKQIAFVNKLANDLHINLRDVDTTYKQFLGATESSIGMEKSMKTFETIQKFGVMVGATPEALKRGTKAIQQMLSKQKLSAEELTGQLAEASLIPGSTQVFADVLEGTGERGSGSVKKLFANMKDGKYELQDIVRVLDLLQSRINQDQLEKMFDRPAAAMADLQNSMTRFWMAVNEEGGLDLQTTILGGLAKTLNDVTEWIKENKEEIGLWTTRLKIVASTLWELAPALLAVYGTMKLIKLLRWAGVLGNLLGGAGNRRLLRRLLLGGSISMSEVMASLFGIGRFGARLTFTEALKKMFMGSLKLLKRSLLVAIPLFFSDLYDTLIGKDTFLSQAANSEWGILRIPAKIVIAFGEALEAVGTIMGGIAALIGGASWEEVWAGWKEFFAQFGVTSGLADELPDGWLDPLFKRFGLFFDWVRSNVVALSTAFSNLGGGNFSGARAAIGGMSEWSTYLREHDVKPQMLPPVQQSLNYRPRANNSATPVVSAPVVNLTVNASGTAEEMAKMASKTVTDMITSTILGSMVNYQHGAA